MLHSPIGKRKPVEPLHELSDRHDELAESLRNLLKSDPLEEEDSEAQRALSKLIKSSRKNYQATSVQLTERYTKMGSLEEAQPTRGERCDLRVEVKQFIELINGVLRRCNTDEVSDMDTCSSVSELSYQKPSIKSVDLPSLIEENPLSVSLRAAEEKLVAMSISPVITCSASLVFPNTTIPNASTFPSPLPDENEPSVSTMQACKSTACCSYPGIMLSTNYNPVNYAPTAINLNAAQLTTVLSTTVPFGHSVDHSNIYSSAIMNQGIAPTARDIPSFPTSLRRDARRGYFDTRNVAGGYTEGPNRPLHGGRPSQPFSEPSFSRYRPPIHHVNYDHRQPPMTTEIDAASLHLIKQELFKTSDAPFTGDPHMYRSWLLLLENRMSGLRLEALDVISVLLANTSGEPNKMIRDHLAAGAASPTTTLDKIWDRLGKQYGSPVHICQSMNRKLQLISIIRPPNTKNKLQDLVHVCRMIEASMPTNPELQMYNLATGQREIWIKLPEWIQQQWRKYGYKYSVENFGNVPPFQALVDFIQYRIDELSDPSFDKMPEVKTSKTLKTDVVAAPSEKSEICCLYHDKPGHSIIDCRTFSKLKFQEKRKFASERKLCYRCLGRHIAKNCDNNSSCSKCKGNHTSLMHPDKYYGDKFTSQQQPYSEDKEGFKALGHDKKTMCSVVCGNPDKAMSCSKTLLCEVHHESRPNETFKMYVILDDMSDTSYIDEKLAEQMKLEGHHEKFVLCTLSAMKSEHNALVVGGLWIRGVKENKYFSLPNLYTSSFIPGSLYEVGTPRVVQSIPHLSHYASKFIDLDPSAKPLMLLGRDSGDLMRSICYGKHAPFVHKTELGYALVGSPCPDYKYSNKVKTCLKSSHEHYSSKQVIPAAAVGEKVFDEFQDDDMYGLSKEDERFIEIVNNTTHVNEDGYITINLPFKQDKVSMPNNKLAVYHRSLSTLNKLRKEPDKLDHCVKAMEKNISSGMLNRSLKTSWKHSTKEVHGGFLSL